VAPARCPSIRALRHASLTLVALAASAACSRAPESAPVETTAISVSTAVARVENLRDVIRAPGMVVPSLAAEWVIFAPEPAQVAELPKAEGDPVAVGDLLVRFTVESIAQDVAVRQMELAQATSRLENATAQLDRIAPLFERGVASRNAYEQARDEQATARSAAAQTTNQLAAARALQDTTAIRARFAGVIAKRWHNPGDIVMPGEHDPVLQVVDPTRVQVAVQLPMAELSRVLPGLIATVQPFTESAALPAAVVMRPSSTDSSAPTAEVRLALSGTEILPVDSPVSVEILVDERTDALVVPAAAVVRGDTGTFVVIVGADGLAHRRDVRIGLATRDKVQIAAGLSAGEVVITSDLAELAEGTAIVIR
jgi:RND family efflux transporter MFP subunit